MVSSSNNLGYSEQDMSQILANDAAVKEMEGAAIAWSAHLFEVPVLALKSITDIVDGDRPPQEEFLENLQKAALALKASAPVYYTVSHLSPYVFASSKGQTMEVISSTAFADASSLEC